MRKGSGGKEKGKKDKKKAGFKQTLEYTEDGLKIINMSGQGMTVLPLSVLGGELTHSLIHHFEAIPNSKKLQTTTEMWLLQDIKIQIR